MPARPCQNDPSRLVLYSASSSTRILGSSEDTAGTKNRQVGRMLGDEIRFSGSVVLFYRSRIPHSSGVC